MAERRMFARSVIGSARFLKMPAAARLLYYDLGMSADDDGIVEAFSVMRTTGASEDDLRVLANKGFVRVLNEDFVSYILDWERNNLIRKDRYHPSIYADIKDAECNVLIEPEPTRSTNGEPMVNQRLTEDRLGKERLGKGSIESTADKPPAPTKVTKKSYREFGWVKLNDEEYNRLINDLGEAEAKRCIAYIDESAQTTGNKNKWRDWNLVVRKCSKQDWGLNQRQSQKNPIGHEHGMDRLARMYREEFGE